MLTTLITSADPAIRNQSLDAYASTANRDELLRECAELDHFRKHSPSLYERVRALFFLYAIHRFHLPQKTGVAAKGLVAYAGYEHLLNRRFEEAIAIFLAQQDTHGANEATSSALAEAYHKLAFQTLADQVRRSVRGNQWMFRVGHPDDQPLRICPALLKPETVLRERTPVRMDLSHCGWSDIFFLGMDYPEGARVLNVSIDLGVHGRDADPRPPVEAYLRVIDEPVLRLTSVDLNATADITLLSDVFNFAKDYLGLLKGAVIASGIVPPGLEGCPDIEDGVNSLQALLAKMIAPGHGLELVSSVNDIPKGSRLAVSTNLLACLISLGMRATGQAKNLTGTLDENERRLVAARAILGEWIAGSGGGWQDSGGVWAGMKLIEGVLAQDGDVEHGISRGRLLPQHKILGEADAPAHIRQALQDSLILVHGGMAQNVGPILEMVTEKYLLRSQAEWRARQEALGVLDEILVCLRGKQTTGESAIKRIAGLTTQNFFGPIQTIIPWASTAFTEKLIQRARETFGENFWGFWMLGGMSGGGMGFIVAPEIKAQAQAQLLNIMRETKREMQTALPFAMEPVVYDFAINPHGTYADIWNGSSYITPDANPETTPQLPLPPSYYALHVPALVKQNRATLSAQRRLELDQFSHAAQTNPQLRGATQRLLDVLLPRATTSENAKAETLESLLLQNGFDREQHELIRADLKQGSIGLAQNRLAANTRIEDVHEGDVVIATGSVPAHIQKLGEDALRNGQVAVFSLAAGAGSRWTQGAGVVKALHPFAKFGGTHKNFMEVHVAKTRRVATQFGATIPHIFTTSYLTHTPIAQSLVQHAQTQSSVNVVLSPGKAVGLRMVPMTRDLRFVYEEMSHQRLDEQKEKARASGHAALINWAQGVGEGSDYTDNVPMQCMHPVGHWFEFANALRNGVLAGLIQQNPQLKYLMLHNIDTIGAELDPALLGLHIANKACLSFEVITRKVDDRGGGLAQVDGRVRMVEGLAMPHERDEFALSYYSSNTTWIDLDQLLGVFQLSRTDLGNEARVIEAIRHLAARMPTYITLKDVKKRWGHGQEDIFPVAQFEKLWGDMTALPEVTCSYMVVPRLRGQQLKDQAQLDGWLRDGSAAYVERLCAWE